MKLAKIRCPKCKEHYENYGMLTTCCPNCTEKLDSEYILVRNYVKDHFAATISETSIATGVPFGKIVEYVKLEMLEIRSDTGTFLKCSACGKSIYTGMFCEDCKKRVNTSQQVILGKTQHMESKMYITVSEENTPGPTIKQNKRL